MARKPKDLVVPEGMKWCSYQDGHLEKVAEFGKNRSNRDGLQSRCRPCTRIADKVYADKRWLKQPTVPSAESKTCRDCKKALPLDSFNRRKASSDGRQYACRECSKSATRRYHSASHAHRLAYGRSYNERNRDARRAYQARNRQRKAETNKQWKQRNWDRVKEQVRKRQALKRDALYLGHTVEDLQQKLSYYGGKCWICRTAEHEHWDHVKPLSKGGAHILANLRPSCATCNLSKSDKWPFVPAMISINQSAYALAN